MPNRLDFIAVYVIIVTACSEHKMLLLLVLYAAPHGYMLHHTCLHGWLSSLLLQEKQINRRAQPVHRRKRKAETPPSIDGDSTTGQEKRAKQEEGDGGFLPALLVLRLCNQHCIAADDASSTPPSSEAGSDDIIELQIRPHPRHSGLHQMPIKTLATSSLCTVSHLLRFIKLNMASPLEAGTSSL